MEKKKINKIIIIFIAIFIFDAKRSLTFLFFH